MRRKTDWEKICQEYYGSGLRQSEYCRKNNIQQSSLSKCLSSGMGKGVGFVEISVNPSGKKEGGEYRILLNNHREVRIPVGVGINEEVLRNLIRVCESC